MAPDDAPQTPRRRGRPPGSKTQARGANGSGSALITRLNAMVAELISKNRKLERQVAKLSERAGAAASTKNVERRLRTISKRVKKALGGSTTRKRRKAAPVNGRRRKTATRRRKSS